MQLKTAGDLRGFLADVLVGVRDGSIDANKANAISKVAAQINQSLATEISTKLRLKELGEPFAGSLAIATSVAESEPPIELTQAANPEPSKHRALEESLGEAPKLTPVATVAPASPEAWSAKLAAKAVSGERVWCDQCETQVTTSQAVSCKSKFCKAKAAA